MAIHDRQIAEHGGLEGIANEGLLDSALARRRDLLGYGTPDLAELAAAYAFGLGRNHPFIDGNKRVSLVTTGAFLFLNGYSLGMDEADAYATWLALAAGELTEAAVAERLRNSMVKR